MHRCYLFLISLLFFVGVLSTVSQAATLCSIYRNSFAEETQLFVLADGPFSWAIKQKEGFVLIRLQGIQALSPFLAEDLKKLSFKTSFEGNVFEIKIPRQGHTVRVRQVSPFQLVISLKH